MELRGEIRAQFALTPEEAAELLLAIGRTSASASARTESETGRNRLTLGTAMDTATDSAIERMQRAAKKLEEQAKAEAEAVKAKCGAEDSAPEPAHTAQEQTPAQTSATASARTERGTEQERAEQERVQTSASASARTERGSAQEQAEQEQREQPEAETPELAVSLLRQQFGIPAVKEDRDEEQQRRSMELNRAVMAMIRDITRNASARSLADLKSGMEKKEFIRRSLTLAYDGQKFEEKPF
jgi:hypothetical protein|nr:MAG TPA: hypothetical protein [Caudoviricetes sp.]